MRCPHIYSYPKYNNADNKLPKSMLIMFDVLFRSLAFDTDSWHTYRLQHQLKQIVMYQGILLGHALKSK